MWRNLLTVVTITQLLHAQMQFPDDTISSFDASRNFPVYDQFTDKIISRDVLQLILNINRASTNLGSHDNTAYSPINIVAVLALVLMGSSGRTLQEISSIIINSKNRMDINSFHNNFGKMLEKLEISSRVKFASAVFVQEGYPIRGTYRRNAESIYKNQIRNVDFANNPVGARQVVNSWVSHKTNGKIKELIKGTFSRGTKVILANAMYFKAEWETPFIEYATKKRPFYTNGRTAPSHVKVEMMLVAGDFPYYNDKALNCEIIGLPYKGKQATMYVVIPRDSNKQKLRRLEFQLNYSQIERLVSNVRYTETHIAFPKMQIDSTIDLKQSLQKLGVKSLFNPFEANLEQLSSGFDSGNPGLYVDSVIHKVYIDITESGTEAAAVSAGTIVKSGDVVFVPVDVPFFFFIMDEGTKALLFWGSVYTPTPKF